MVLGSGDHTIVGRIFVIGSLALLALNLVAAALSRSAWPAAAPSPTSW